MKTNFKKKAIVSNANNTSSLELPYEFQTGNDTTIKSDHIEILNTKSSDEVNAVDEQDNSIPSDTGTKYNYKAVIHNSSENSTNNAVVNTDQYMENLLKWDFEIDLITKKLQEILKSPSPLTLYKKSAELKEDFANFINYIVKKIAIWFNTQNKNVILSMYYNAGYEKVWIENMKIFIDDLKYIDVNLYFQILLILQKKQQYIAKILIKIFKKEPKENIIKFRNKFCPEINIEDTYKKYELLWVNNLKWIIDTNCIDENNASEFLYQIYLRQEQSRETLFYLFSFSQEDVTDKFDDIYSVFALIALYYLNDISYKDRQTLLYLKQKKNISIIKSIDSLIDSYLENKDYFFEKIINLIWEKGQTERSYFYSYIKTQLINKYYQEVRRLFYWDKHVCSNRNEWANFRWNFVNSSKSQFPKDVQEILAFKKLIIELTSNTFSPFLKPFVYSIVSEKLSVTKKELLKIRYLMTLILSENYTEYKQIYNFFEDLETFMDYNIDGTFSKITFNFRKIKIFAADFIIWFLWLVWLYIYAPVWVFIGCSILAISYLREHFTSFKSWIEWNLWMRTFATAILIVSWFYWITNLDATKIDIAKLSSQVEKIGIYKTDETMKIVNTKVDKLKIKETIADILQFKNNK